MWCAHCLGSEWSEEDKGQLPVVQCSVGGGGDVGVCVWRGRGGKVKERVCGFFFSFLKSFPCGFQIKESMMTH